jgi:Domain of Unknown Function (DUF928)
MKQSIILFFGVFLFSCQLVLAEENKTIPSAFPKFQPRNLGAPKVRVGGGTRGNSNNAELYVIAPEEVGFTTQNHPMLYWYLSKAISKPIEITLIHKFSILLKINIEKEEEPGIHVFNLADYNIKLLPDTKYKWSVAIVNNPKQRSADTFASAGLMLVDETEQFNKKLATADLKEKIWLYAEAGLWYDAFSAIQSLSEQPITSQVPPAGTLRKNLLEQVGLKDIKL